MLVVDDLLLLNVIAGVATPELTEAFESREIFTTGCWYYRLDRALGGAKGTGVLSRSFDALGEQQKRSALIALDRLPPEIGLMSFRRLVPVMRALSGRRQVNLLTAEAVAAALVVGGEIRTSTDSPLMRMACRDLGVPWSQMSR